MPGAFPEFYYLEYQMKKLFIAHTRFMALPVVIAIGVQMATRYMNKELSWREAGTILMSGVLLILLLFPVYLVLRAVWTSLIKT